MKADGLIYVNGDQKSEGKATELGMCMAMLKPIIVIGGRQNNLFLNLNIPAFPSIEDALIWLKGDGQYYLAFVQSKQEEFFHHTTEMSLNGLAAEQALANMEFPSE